MQPLLFAHRTSITIPPIWSIRNNELEHSLRAIKHPKQCKQFPYIHSNCHNHFHIISSIYYTKIRDGKCLQNLSDEGCLVSLTRPHNPSGKTRSCRSTVWCRRVGRTILRSMQFTVRDCIFRKTYMHTLTRLMDGKSLISSFLVHYVASAPVRYCRSCATRDGTLQLFHYFTQKIYILHLRGRRVVSTIPDI